MTKAEVKATLRGFVLDFAIDPVDAGEIFSEIDADGVDRETLGDYLDGAGYPELAAKVYAGAAA